MENSLEFLEFDEQGTPEEHEDVLWTDSPDPDEDELEEEKKASLADSDYEPLKMYLKEMGNIPLLTKEGEIETSKLIEKGRRKLMEIVFSLPFAVEKILKLGEDVRNGETGIDDIIQNNLDSDEERGNNFSDLDRPDKNTLPETKTDPEGRPGTSKKKQ